MLRELNICWIVIIGLLCSQLATAQVEGNSQTISIAGQFYGLHKVNAGETLFSLSKQYRVSIEEIRKVNRLEEGEGLVLNSLLIVPMSLQHKVEIGTVVEAGTTEKQYATHTVKTGETLYSIAREYPFVTTYMIKEENAMTGDTVRIGQVLTIPQSLEKKALFKRRNTDEVLKAERSYQLPEMGEREEEVDFLDIDEQGNMVMEVAEDTTEEVVNELYDFAMLEMLQKQFEVLDTARTEVEVHRGIATWLDDTGVENQKKFYALHKDLPAGTVLKVRNLMNSREVYVKVIGTLPDIPQNQKVVVKLSAAAARYLNVLDDKFLVEFASNTP